MTAVTHPFYCGYINPSLLGDEAVTANYRHELTDSQVTFGTPVSCQYDLGVAGTLTAASLYGGAATQIQTNIDTAVAPFACADTT